MRQCRSHRFDEKDGIKRFLNADREVAGFLIPGAFARKRACKGMPGKHQHQNNEVARTQVHLKEGLLRLQKVAEDNFIPGDFKDQCLTMSGLIAIRWLLSYFPLATAMPVRRPKVKMSQMALPPRRFVP